MVPMISPPIATSESGDNFSSPTAHSKAIGIMPAMVPKAVISTGRKRTRTDSTADSVSESHVAACAGSTAQNRRKKKIIGNSLVLLKKMSIGMSLFKFF